MDVSELHNQYPRSQAVKFFLKNFLFFAYNSTQNSIFNKNYNLELNVTVI